MEEIFRIGHVVLRKQVEPISVLQETIHSNLELHSESGRIVEVSGVQSGRTRMGTEVMIAPSGATINHPEHGILEIPPGTYEVSQVREARPEEERVRGIRFEPPLSATSALTREQRD